MFILLFTKVLSFSIIFLVLFFTKFLAISLNSKKIFLYKSLSLYIVVWIMEALVVSFNQKNTTEINLVVSVKTQNFQKKKHFKWLSVLQKYTTFRFSSLVYDLKALLSGRKVTETIQSQVSTYFYFVKKVIFAMWKRGPGIEHMLWSRFTI